MWMFVWPNFQLGFLSSGGLHCWLISELCGLSFNKVGWLGFGLLQGTRCVVSTGMHLALDNEIHMNAWCMIAMYICSWIKVGGGLVKGLNQYSHSGQTSIQRDIDLQYATVDQLAEIIDTMASLRDPILGLGQRIDGHQAPPVPIHGTTLHDSSTPPPPPSRPTIQSNYTVPSPPPPSVQSAPQAGAFVLHGQNETIPHSIVAPAQVTEDT
ncbi:hypothetical protein AAG906_027898 [Vitis piasezkii]